MADEEDEEARESPAEARYRRRVGITLAVLAVVAAWIAVMGTNAGTSESTTTREATRLAVEAQTAAVVAGGVDAGLEAVDAEIDLLGNRTAFSTPEEVAEELGIQVDPAAAQARLDQAEDTLRELVGDRTERATDLAVEAERLNLEQKVTVQQRITWNAKASQYETVLTVLAVAVFLVGFTLVIGRRLRPPVAVPGVVLAVVCVGWAGQIYLKPVPEVDPDAIAATANGQVALEQDRPDEAVDDFSEALGIEPEYVPALVGRGLARIVEANPDLLETLAVTDPGAEVVRSGVRDIRAAIDASDDQDPVTLAVASLVATLAGEWDTAAGYLDDAVELNETAVELYLWRAAVEVARADPAAAESWLDQARARFSDLDSDRRRALAAQYLSLLELVIEKDPAQAAQAEAFRDAGLAAVTETAVGRPLRPVDTSGISFEIGEATYADGTTTVAVPTSGVPPDAAVAVVGYERPAPGAGWVQPAELFYAGPSAGDGSGVTIETPRNCVAVEYRFDLYVEGERVGTRTAPGGDPTC